MDFQCIIFTLLKMKEKTHLHLILQNRYGRPVMAIITSSSSELVETGEGERDPERLLPALS